jgi:Flp pilus assembly protein TadG
MKTGRTLKGPAGFLSRLKTRVMRLRGEEGTELVEFAFVVPWLVALLTGTMSFALAFYSLQQLGNAATNAVEVVAEDAGLSIDPCNTAMTQVQSSLPGWVKANFTYTLYVTPTGGGTASSYTSAAGANGGATAFSCTGAESVESSTQPEPVVLTVSYNYHWLPILKWAVSSPLTATESAVSGF